MKTSPLSPPIMVEDYKKGKLPPPISNSTIGQLASPGRNEWQELNRRKPSASIVQPIGQLTLALLSPTLRDRWPVDFECVARQRRGNHATE